MAIPAGALLMLGSGALLVSSALPGRASTSVGGNVPVDAGATDPLDISTNNSPALARNPRRPGNVVVANRIDAPRYSCALRVSFDDGAGWQQTPVPFPAGEELPARCYAPDAAFGADGTLYVSFVTLTGIGNGPNAVWISSSGDGGRTLSTPRRVTGPRAFQVRLTADPAVQGRLYLSWLLARSVGTLLFPDVGNPIVLSRSDDGGRSWSRPVQVNSLDRVRIVAPSTAVGPDGMLYLLYLDLGNDRLDYNGGSGGRGGQPYPGPWSLVLARSTDGGASWNESVVDPTVVPTTRFVVFLPPFPSLAVDQHSGRVYVGFTDGRAGDADVRVWSSADRGAHFGPGVRVNDTPLGDRTAQYLPQLAVAPDGRLDVLYYDRRADPNNVMNEVSLQSSYNHGMSFTARTRLSDGPFDSRVAPNANANLPDLGSGLGLVSANRTALAVWTDTRAGDEISGKQDLASAAVELRAASRWHTPVRDIGLAAVTLGIVAALMAAVFAGLPRMVVRGSTLASSALGGRRVHHTGLEPVSSAGGGRRGETTADAVPPGTLVPDVAAPSEPSLAPTNSDEPLTAGVAVLGDGVGEIVGGQSPSSMQPGRPSAPDTDGDAPKGSTAAAGEAGADDPG
ncbi:MAG: sialidase family protein [Mycobacteriales bacterium]